MSNYKKPSLLTSWLIRMMGDIVAPRGKGEGRLCIVNYHRILEAPDPLLESEPDPDTFRWQMELLAKYFNVMPLHEALLALNSDRMPPRTVCITFDDGYRSVHDLALPILKEFNLPATVFVTTGYMTHGAMWNDRIIEAIRHLPNGDLDLRDIGLGLHRIETLDDRKHIVDKLTDESKYLPPQARLDVSKRLEDLAGQIALEGLMLTTEMIATLSREGIEIGGHTVSHPILTSLEDAAAREEIVANKLHLESIIGKPVRLFAYPNGKAGVDFDERHVQIAKDAGFEAAFTTAPGAATMENEPFRIPRSRPWDTTPFRFGLRLVRWLASDVQSAAPAASDGQKAAGTISHKKSIGISFAGQYLELTLHFLAVLVLARILSPEDIGTYSVAAFLMAVLHSFRDFGVVQYIIQEHELTTEKIRSAMGVAIMLALAVAAVLLASSGLIAHFYGNPAIEKILWVMAGSFAVSPFGSLMGGIFRREMQLKKIFYVRITSTLCHVAVAISLAMQGFGALSLAWANFAGILSYGIAANVLRNRNLPWVPRFRNVKTILSFGSIAAVGNAASTVGTNVPDLIVGKVMDMASVGYLSRANGLVQLFTRFLTDALMPLILPYFAQIRRQGNNLAEHYLSSVVYLTAFAWPFFAAMMLLAYPLVRTLYGPQWDASVPLVEYLCLAGAVSSISMFAGQVMVANGQVRNSTYSQLIAQPFRIAAVFVAASYGLLSIAIAIIASELLTLVIVSWYLHKTINVGLGSLMRACSKSALVTLCSALVPMLVRLVWSPEHTSQAHSWIPLTIGIFGAALGWVIGVILTRHPLAPHLVSACGSALLTLRNLGKPTN